MINLRQVLEAGACAAFAVANPDHKHFVDTDGILDPSPKLARKRYAWLKQNYPAGSDAIERMKKQINLEAAHANLIGAQANFHTNYKEG